jgi:hypothetical protein
MEMLRPFCQKLMLSSVTVCVWVGVAVADTQPVWKLYDLRDLVVLIPPLSSDRAVSSMFSSDALLNITATQAERVHGLSVFSGGIAGEPATEPSGAAADSDALNKVVNTLCQTLEIDCARMFTGVYGVTAEEAQHAVLLQSLEQVRALYAERYDVEIVRFVVPVDQAPAIGDKVVPTPVAHVDRFVALRRTPAPLTRVSMSRFVSELIPVVATGSVGYSMETQYAVDGLRAVVLVGAGPQDQAKTSFHMVGHLREVVLDKTSTPISDNQNIHLQVDLPEIKVRSIYSNVEMEYGQLAVVSVVDAFAEGQSFVIAARITKLPR